MGGSPEAASKNHYFTRGSLATLANHLQSPGEGGPRCEKQIPVVPQPGDHVTDGCLVWILARVWSHSSFSPVPSESCTPRGFFFDSFFFAFIPPSIVLCLYFAALILAPRGQSRSTLPGENVFPHVNVKKCCNTRFGSNISWIWFELYVLVCSWHYF